MNTRSHQEESMMSRNNKPTSVSSAVRKATTAAAATALAIPLVAAGGAALASGTSTSAEGPTGSGPVKYDPVCADTGFNKWVHGADGYWYYQVNREPAVYRIGTCDLQGSDGLTYHFRDYDDARKDGKPVGSAVTGWYKRSWTGGAATWRYFDPSGAHMITGWNKIGGSWYLFAGNGDMRTGWAQDGGAWYYLGQDGAMRTGWLEEGGAWYYLHPSGRMATGRTIINGVVHWFDASGRLVS